MLRNISKNASRSQVVVSLLISAMVASTPQSAFSGFTGGVPSVMKSQGPCLYSVQLQTSVAERKRYLVKLSEVTGGAYASNSPVEDMYNNIEPASADSDLWGLETKQIMQKVGVDSFSTDCISCHDGASAVAIGVDLRNDPVRSSTHRKPSGTDHPIGMDYQSYVAANGGKYKPIFGGSNKMVFVNGKVGCLTCHDPMNPERGHLVMSDRQSALCLSCHDT